MSSYGNCNVIYGSIAGASNNIIDTVFNPKLIFLGTYYANALFAGFGMNCNNEGSYYYMADRVDSSAGYTDIAIVEFHSSSIKLSNRLNAVVYYAIFG